MTWDWVTEVVIVVHGSRLKAMFAVLSGTVWGLVPLALAYNDPDVVHSLAFILNIGVAALITIGGIYLIVARPKLVMNEHGFTMNWIGLLKTSVDWSDIKEWGVIRPLGVNQIGWNFYERSKPLGVWASFSKAVGGMDGGLPGILAKAPRCLASDFDVFILEKRMPDA